MPKRTYGRAFGKRKRTPAAKRRRRVMRRRPRKSNTRVKSIVSFGRAFPKKLLVTHRYMENISLQSIAGSTASYQFVCNGMYDPNNTGLGHQPMFYDQCSALYNHYHVIGSKIFVRVVANSANSGCAYITLLQDDDTVAGLTTFESSELPQTSMRLIPAGSNNGFHLSNKFSARKTYGKSVLANSNLRGTTSSNPAETKLWRISLQEQAGLTHTLRVMVSITYIAIWTEQRELGQS